MPNRTRWYAELAGTILLWVEEVLDHPNNPPFSWRGTVARRPLKLRLEGPEDHTIRFAPDPFFEKSAKAAMEGAERTVANSTFLHEYAPRLGELMWKEWDRSDKEWEEWKGRFMMDGCTE